VSTGTVTGALAGRAEITDEDFALVVRVAIDCIPGTRIAVIRALRSGTNPYSIGLANVLVSRALEDLGSLGICERREASASEYSFTQAAEGLLGGCGLTFPQNVCERYGGK
jgi:hypothetical protein